MTARSGPGYHHDIPWPNSSGSSLSTDIDKDDVMTRRGSGLWLGLLATFLLFTTPSWSQQTSTDELQKEIEGLRESMKAMEKELREIKLLLQSLASAARRPRGVTLDLDDNPFRGQRTARLTLVEFSDYQCAFCRRHVRETVPQIEKEYVETGKLKYVFLDFPLEEVHGLAFKAAEAANCAGEQGKYWEMHAQLFASQQGLEPWTGHARAIGLDLSKFEECLDSGREAAEIRRDLNEAWKAGVTRTPTFFLAYTDPGSSKITSVTRLTGAEPYPTFKAAIDKLLAQAPEAARGQSDGGR
jgi:protein-disulfide isomerase